VLRVREFEDWIIETRRQLHRNPELSFEEVRRVPYSATLCAHASLPKSLLY
jgi:metal-dependent amidase/aminoacylase/carboxypeptidase family protein